MLSSDDIVGTGVGDPSSLLAKVDCLECCSDWASNSLLDEMSKDCFGVVPYTVILTGSYSTGVEIGDMLKLSVAILHFSEEEGS